ncbi:unnamed protein product [Lymnaea stagnalis]|uniref:Uncharacterized protein n=1 Tax=Lymnaea stagnalis TaxID=6523 RepID=A0AAV2HYT7_LYMST
MQRLCDVVCLVAVAVILKQFCVDALPRSPEQFKGYKYAPGAYRRGRGDYGQGGANQYAQGVTTECPSQASESFLNFLAVLSGDYGRSQFKVGDYVYDTPSSLILKPVESSIVQWGLFAEDFEYSKVVRRGILSSVPDANSNLIDVFPFNFTNVVSNLDGSFDNSVLSCLRPSDLNYTHSCDRVVAPTSDPLVFKFTKWPFCSDTLDNPPIYSAVANCTHIVVTFRDIRLPVDYVPQNKLVQFILIKTASFPLLPSWTGGSYCRNPCLTY